MKAREKEERGKQWKGEKEENGIMISIKRHLDLYF